MSKHKRICMLTNTVIGSRSQDHIQLTTNRVHAFMASTNIYENIRVSILKSTHGHAHRSYTKQLFIIQTNLTFCQAVFIAFLTRGCNLREYC